MKLSNEEYDLIYKKLEYRFKNSNHDLVSKIENKQDLTPDDVDLLLKKLEYKFRKSENEIINKLSNYLNYQNYSPVKFSNIKAKKKRDLKKLDENAVLNFEDYMKKEYE
jgi:hypothetical protein